MNPIVLTVEIVETLKQIKLRKYNYVTSHRKVTNRFNYG